MPQSRHRKRWIKLWTQESLYGSISKELQPDERWCWIGVLLLAGDSPEAGKLLIAPGIPWEDSQIAKALSVPTEVWMRAKQKMLSAGKIVLNSDTIMVCNWDKYQNSRDDYMREYMRQYRSKKEESNKEEKTNNNKEEEEEEEEEETVNLTSKSNNRHTNSKTNSEKSFELYIEENLKPRFPEVDVDLELEAFNLYWAKQKKQPSDWKRAFLNWLKKEREYRQRKEYQSNMERARQRGYRGDPHPNESYKGEW